MQRTLEQFLQPDTRLLLQDLQSGTSRRFQKLNEAIAQLIDDWSMISYTPLDYSDEDSIAYLLSQVLSPQCILPQESILLCADNIIEAS